MGKCTIVVFGVPSTEIHYHLISLISNRHLWYAQCQDVTFMFVFSAKTSSIDDHYQTKAKLCNKITVLISIFNESFLWPVSFLTLALLSGTTTRITCIHSMVFVLV